MRTELRISFGVPSGKSVELPLSKSVAMRALTLNEVSARVSGRRAVIQALPDAEDVEGMVRALRCYEAGSRRVNIGEGGAPFRFFTALTASTPGVELTLHTRRPLLRRPHAILLDALRRAGADVRPLRRPGRPPLRITGKLLSPHSLTMDPGVSSQYISALMMAAPLWKNGLDLRFNGGRPVSLPYLRMTADVMRRFGCGVDVREEWISVAPGKCRAPERYAIPSDWSAASYLYEMALIAPGREIRISDLTPPHESLQGDAVCSEIFRRLGVRTLRNDDGSVTIVRPSNAPEAWPCGHEGDDGFILDLNGTPDLAPALAVGFCLAGVRFRFDNVGHLRHKETDRMAALAAELRKLGYALHTSEESMGWNGERCEAESAPRIATYSDHRMAMAFAPAALMYPGMVIENPEVVGKSFPRYWEMLRRLGASLEWDEGNC